MRAEDLVGVWSLDEFVVVAAAETAHPLGRKPRGRLHLAANGELLVTVLAETRARFASDDMRVGSVEEAAGAFVSAISYFGQWRFDPAQAALVTRVQGSLFPNWEGTSQTRFVVLSESGQLTLRTPPVPWERVMREGMLRWSRIH